MTGNIKESMKLKTVDLTFKKNLKQSLRFNVNDKVWIAASTRPGEEDIILRAFKKLKINITNLSLILAPRHPKRAQEIETAVKSLNLQYNKKSEINSNTKEESVLILDTLGELSNLFCIADTAFVGGTLKPFGGHNLLEPLPYLVPVCFGPYCETQKESVKLIKDNQCGKKVEDEEELFAFILKVFNDKRFYNQIINNIRQLLNKSDIKLKANIDLI